MAGYRSLAAPWIGGASSAPAVQNGGYRSLLAFWIGGASSLVQQPEQAANNGSAKKPKRRRKPVAFENPPSLVFGGFAEPTPEPVTVAPVIEALPAVSEPVPETVISPLEPVSIEFPTEEILETVRRKRRNQRLKIALAYWLLH